LCWLEVAGGGGTGEEAGISGSISDGGGGGHRGGDCGGLHLLGSANARARRRRGSIQGIYQARDTMGLCSREASCLPAALFLPQDPSSFSRSRRILPRLMQLQRPTIVPW